MVQRCGAKIPHSPGRLARAASFGEAALTAYLKRDRCKCWPVRGRLRCRHHGGRTLTSEQHRVRKALAADTKVTTVAGDAQILPAAQGQ